MVRKKKKYAEGFTPENASETSLALYKQERLRELVFSFQNTNTEKGN